MFQAELGRMMREEQHRDYLREAKRKERAAEKRQPRPNSTRGLLVLPLVLVTMVARLVAFSTHALHH